MNPNTDAFCREHLNGEYAALSSQVAALTCKRPFQKCREGTPPHDLILGGDFNLAVGIRHTGEPVPSDPPWLLQRLRPQFDLMRCWQAVLGGGIDRSHQ